VAGLDSPNGWVRDTAQRLLVESRDTNALPALLKLAAHSTNELARIHALWAIEGLLLWPHSDREADRLAIARRSSTQTVVKLESVQRNFVWQAPELPDEVMAVLLDAIRTGPTQVKVAAIRAADSLTQCSPARQRQLQAVLTGGLVGARDEVLFQIALTAGNLPKPDSLTLLASIADQKSDELLIREAIMSGLQNWELRFLESLLQAPAWARRNPGRPALIQSLAAAVLVERHADKIERLLMLAHDQTEGTVWRRMAILAGLASVKPRRSDRPVRFAAAPEAFIRLAAGSDAEVRLLVEQIRPLLAWPGHQWTETEGAAGDQQKPALSSADETVLAEGAVLYQQVCAGCHGLAGEGVKPLAPPLAKSDWVTGSEDRLIRILLHGLAGPIQVSGVTYQPPDIQPEMPPLAALADAQIAAVLSYVRNEWGGPGAIVAAERVGRIRTETIQREVPWTEAALNEVR